MNRNDQPQRDYFAVWDVAKMLNCSPGYISRRAKEGLIRAIRIHSSARYRIPAEEVQRLLKRKEKALVGQPLISKYDRL